MYGKKFSIVTYEKQLTEKRYDELIRLYSLQGRAAPMAYFDISLDALVNSFDKPGPVLDEFKKASERAIDKGAEVILPGCGLLNLICVENELTKVCNATVLDVSGALMKTLDAMITLRKKSGITTSRQGLYASPTDAQLQAAKKIYGVKW
jgi:Asp/Glu/hydantoin racemase